MKEDSLSPFYGLCLKSPEEKKFRRDVVPGACPERSRRDGGMGVPPISKASPFLQGRGLGGWSNPGANPESQTCKRLLGQGSSGREAKPWRSSVLHAPRASGSFPVFDQGCNTLKGHPLSGKLKSGDANGGEEEDKVSQQGKAECQPLVYPKHP